MPKTKISKTLRHVIREYIKALRHDGLPIEHVFLFGSFAKGNPHPWSDVDLCVVSPKFHDTIDAIQYLLSRRKLNLRYPIEPIGFHPSVFKKNIPLVQEIKTNGIRIT